MELLKLSEWNVKMAKSFWERRVENAEDASLSTSSPTRVERSGMEEKNRFGDDAVVSSFNGNDGEEKERKRTVQGRTMRGA